MEDRLTNLKRLLLSCCSCARATTARVGSSRNCRLESKNSGCVVCASSSRFNELLKKCDLYFAARVTEIVYNSPHVQARISHLLISGFDGAHGRMVLLRSVANWQKRHDLLEEPRENFPMSILLDWLMGRSLWRAQRVSRATATTALGDRFQRNGMRGGAETASVRFSDWHKLFRTAEAITRQSCVIWQMRNARGWA